MSTSENSIRGNPYAGRTVVVGVAGGIAAYKAVELVRLLDKAGATVQVVMSRAATEFVGPVTFQALSGRPVFTDLWNLEEESEIGHIAAADSADLVIVAPATANLIARAAAGRASDALSAVLLATRAPVLLAPSMNVNMWQHPATRANVARLAQRESISIVGPGVGFLACRWEGAGRLAEPADIVEAGAHILSPADLAGRRVVITAGPTREPLDPVRFLSNHSSGKMGYAIARAASRRGAAVDLVSGPVELSAPAGVNVTRVETAEQMLAATEAHGTGADAVVMVAAVADLRPREVQAGKIKKASLGSEPRLELARNPDILAQLGAKRAASGRALPILVGFAAETSEVVANARTKLAAKAVDLIVANDVSQRDIGFASDDNRVVLVSHQGERPLELASKDAIADQICDRLLELLAAASDPALKVVT